ncbi:histidine kinase dimerization/phospho-acceptor domain-containing protein [Slackia sp.]|uniref:sensor histidine kinase n=1 Tax=Slackia sp. TaxID=2049041 RepID=UPI00257A5A2F|nr:histidine kinase dimerization/phospho-acceptor domain-containing protein [Slackia sp.]MBS6499812.1 HAMP domain-containing protein [Slackia sp.]
MEIGDLVGIASISIPTDQYKRDLAIRIGQRAFLSAGVLAACLLTIILVSRRFVIRPLRKVEGAVQAVASGDLETMIDPDAIGARGEIRTLSEQFNAMTSDLDALHRNLEGLVEVRTEQLAEANDSLEEQARILEEMNKRLTENDLYKSHFFVMMSHELRTPITAIRAFTAMLADSEDLDRETVSSAIQAIRTNSQSLSRLVDNLLESARMEAGAVNGLAHMTDELSSGK